MSKCLICQNEIPKPKPRRGFQNAYCSNACRQRAYRQRAERDSCNDFALQVSANLNLKSASSPVHIANPPVRYTGGKWRIAGWIIEQFPAHTCYVEPFCGGASVLFRKPPSKLEVINDLNHDIVNFFQVLRTRRDELVQAILLTPYAEEEYRQAHRTGGITDSLERARLFYIRNKMSFGAGEGRASGWRYMVNDKRGKVLTEEWNQVDHLIAAATRLKMVQICSSDYRQCLVRFDDTKTLFYVDPPYPAQTRHENRAYYRHEMLNDSQHIELAERLNQLRGMVILSGYDCDLYGDLFRDWRKVEKPTRTNGNFAATECLWLSPNCEQAQMPLFKERA